MKDRYRRNLERTGRHEQKRQRLGTPDPACTICGSMNLTALTLMPFSQLPEPIRRRVSEGHHLAGHEAGKWVVIVCLNCHAVLSDAQYDWDKRLRHPQTKSERTVAYLRGLADMFRLEGETRSTQAGELEALADELMSEDTH